MLNLIRRAVKSWVAKALLALLIASFAVWGIGDIFTFRLDSSVAEVGDTRVSAERYASALRREQSRLSQQAGQLVSIEVLRQLGIDRRVLARLIRDAAFAEELQTVGLSAPDEAVAEAIRNDPAFQGPGGSFNDAAYRALIQQQGLSPAEFEALTRQLLGQQILIETLAQGAVPAGAAVRIAAYRGETRDIAQLLLPPDLAETPAQPDEAALQEFYQANPDRYTQPERRYARYIHVDIDRLAADAQPGEDAVRAAYEAEKDRFTTPPTRTLESIPMPDAEAANAALARINTGEITFEALAEERGISADALSLGTVRPDELPDMTSEAVFGASEPGVIGPVPTPVGSSVVRITGLTQGGTQPFEEVRARLAERLARDAALDAAPDLANRIEEERAAGKPLDQIARELRLTFGEVEGLAADGTLADGSAATGVEATEAFLREVFDALDLEERDIIDTEDGGFLLVVVDRIEERALAPFEEVKEEVAEDWGASARLDAVEQRANALAARLAEGVTMQELADELGLPLSQFDDIGRFDEDPNLPPDLLVQLFGQAEGGTAIARSPDGEGVILARVAAVNPVEPDALASTSAEVEQVLADSIASDTIEYFGRAIETRHGASIDQSVLDEVYRLVSSGAG